MKTKGSFKPYSKPNMHKELEDLICANFIEHDITFLSELLRNTSINIECSCCTSNLDQLMAIRRDLIKELPRISRT